MNGFHALSVAQVHAGPPSLISPWAGGDLRLFLDEKDGARHLQNELVVAPAEQEVLQMTFFMGEHDQQVDLVFFDGSQDLRGWLSLLELYADVQPALPFLFDDLSSSCLVFFKRFW